MNQQCVEMRMSMRGVSQAEDEQLVSDDQECRKTGRTIITITVSTGSFSLRSIENVVTTPHHHHRVWLVCLIVLSPRWAARCLQSILLTGSRAFRGIVLGQCQWVRECVFIKYEVKHFNLLWWHSLNNETQCLITNTGCSYIKWPYLSTFHIFVLSHKTWKQVDKNLAHVAVFYWA